VLIEALLLIEASFLRTQAELGLQVLRGVKHTEAEGSGDQGKPGEPGHRHGSKNATKRKVSK
jgi:hypothetical protein